MQILMNILYIVLFIICLSVLIVVHELGHLAAAKAFGVYCNEFSIGFGPKIFSKKRKNGETYVSVRCIPFGGYVSMYGEGMELPEGKEIPPERALTGIKKWKRAIILGAGVFMNAILALTVFFSYECFFQKTDLSASDVSVAEKYEDGTDTIAKLAGFEGGEKIALVQTNLDYVYGIDPAAVVEYTNGDTKVVYAVLDGSSVLGYDKLSWGYYLHFCFADADNNISYEANKQITPSAEIKSVSFVVKEVEYNEAKKEYELTGKYFNVKTECKIQENGYYGFQDLGLFITAYKHYNKNFGVTIKNTFVDFGESSVAIVTGFVKMFTTKEGFQSAGGIIAIANETTNILKNYGWATFIRVWGLISVNLAIMNLLPFPGLDGWQLLVLIIEGVAHKEIPQNVKGIISFIGIALLFALMFVLLVTDAIKYIF